MEEASAERVLAVHDLERTVDDVVLAEQGETVHANYLGRYRAGDVSAVRDEQVLIRRILIGDQTKPVRANGSRIKETHVPHRSRNC